MRHFLGAFLLLFILSGCIKEEHYLNDQFQIEGLDPSFALPLVYTNLTLSDIEQEFDSENFIFNEDEQTFALVYDGELFNLGADDLQAIDAEAFETAYTLSAVEATAINLLPEGTTAEIGQAIPLSFNADNGEALDSLRFSGGSMALELSSTIPHDVTLFLTIPELTQNGVPFQEFVDFQYPGFTPFDTELAFDLEGYVLDLTQGGMTSNSFTLDIQGFVTSTGETTNPGDEIAISLTLDISQLASAFGYFGQLSAISSVDTQFVDLYRDLNNGILHFADPRIDLDIYNTSGVPAQVSVEGVFAPENAQDQQLGGSDLTNFPVIAAASNPGAEAITEHNFTNAGTVPTLTELLDEGPFELIYTSTININPLGQTQNFLLDTSRIRCDVEMILPFFGYADNFSLIDTLDLDLAEALGVGDEEEISWEDLKQATIRLVADNGLPIQIDGQVYFADTLFNVVDSLFKEPWEAIFQQGFVDFSLSENDPNFGRVLSVTREITDVTLSREQVRELLDGEVKKVILKGRANTNQAQNQQLVRFYPEYTLGLKLSAKIDTDISINE